MKVGTSRGEQQLKVKVEDMQLLLDALERIQQQAAKTNDNENLKPGERLFE